MDFGNCSYRELSPLDFLSETDCQMMGFVVATVLLAVGSASSMPGFDHRAFWCVLNQQRLGSG